MSPSIPSESAFSATAEPAAGVDAELLIVPVWGEDDRLDDLPGIDDAVMGEWTRARATREFSGKPFSGVTATVVAPAWKARHVHFIMAGGTTTETLRWQRVGAAGGRVARQRRVERCAILLRRAVDVERAAEAAADGFVTAEFDGATYKKAQDAAPAARPISLTAVVPGGRVESLAAALERGRIVGTAVNAARAFTNEPGNVLTPREFASRVSTLAQSAGLAVETLDEVQMAELRMGLLLAVAQGSAEAPRLIVVRHDPPGAPESPVFAFVGKGVTFDTGGVSIKPAESMDRMKHDMAGGAAVAGALAAIAALGVPFRTIGIIPTVENMVGGRAMRPGDVVAGANGKTVEILNTDAEGRLILADALWYAQQIGATHLVDVATLTGACMVALGRTVTGLMGAPDDWVDTVRAAGERGGDVLWPLPIYDEAREQLRSEIADMSNIGGRAGGAITAAAFLREFTGGLPWAHLDIAGTAWAETRTPYLPKGATGVAVRTLIEVAKSGASVRRTD